MVELFSIYLTKDKEARVGINEELLELYGLTLEELSKNWDKENLIKAIGDFTDILEKNDKLRGE